jgi:16S rRNA (cytosine967-C5)-methyltransferase
MSKKSGALTRSVAIDALTHILQRHQHADIALERLFKAKPELSSIDRAFVFEMVYGALRWLFKMDWIMGHMIDRPFSSLDPRVANALRIGTYQIYYMDRVPDRAAVAETVEAVKLIGAAPAASLVNAVLRRVARKAEYFQKPDKEKNTNAYLAMHHAHPAWMIDRWSRTVSLERLEHLLASHNTPPQKTLRILKKRPVPGGEDLATHLLKSFGIKSTHRPLKSALRVMDYPDFSQCAAFHAGSYIVQDEAAQLAASLVQVETGQNVLDACAAPGGKALAIWDQSPEGVHFYLSDSGRKRLTTLQQNLARVALFPEAIQVAHADAAEAFPGVSFHHIVLDAPCSAMGVIGRHPEIKWHRVPQDIKNCATEQKRLLDQLASRLLPGGELIYMVCTFEPEETTDQIEQFLQRHSDFTRVDLNGRIHDYYRKYLTHAGDLLILSGNPDKIDGFYASVLRKTAP